MYSIDFHVLCHVMQDKANPLATVLSAAMLLKYGLGEAGAAEIIEAAVLNTLDGGFRTGDIYSAGNVLLFINVSPSFLLQQSLKLRITTVATNQRSFNSCS